MDKNTIIGLVLLFLIMIGFMWWQSPSKEEKAAMKHKQDSIALVQQQQYDSLTKMEEDAKLATLDTSLVAKNDSVHQEAVKMEQTALGLFSNTSKGERKEISVENEVFNLKFCNHGGKISSVVLKDYKTFEKKTLELLSEKSSMLDLMFKTSDNRIINTSKLSFQVFVNGEAVTDSTKLYTVKGKDSLQIAMRAFANATDSATALYNTNKYIEFRYTVFGEKYDVKYSIDFINMQNDIASEVPFMDLAFNCKMNRFEKNAKNERQTASIHYKPITEDADNLKDGKDGKDNLKSPLKWISFKQQFFNISLIAQNQFDNADIEVETKASKDPYYLCDMKSLVGVPYTPSEKYSMDMQFYFGPNKYKILKGYNIELEKLIPLGWGILGWINRFAVIPVFNYFEQFNWNYGIIILVLTVILKIVLLPIAYKSYASSAKMKILQPDINVISEKYPKKEQALEKQKAVMALYKKAGASPLSGCIPMLLQFPILIAMFRFFPASIELRQQPFLWADDLSTYDSVLSLPFNIPIYGDHVSLFCLLMALANLAYTIQNMKQQTQSNALPGMKTMMYFMPLMLLFMFNSFSSALNYYYFLSTCITFFQMWIIRKTINEDKIRKKIQMASAKPVKKSGFMERIEKMQRMNQEAVQQRQNQGKKR